MLQPIIVLAFSKNKGNKIRLYPNFESYLACTCALKNNWGGGLFFSYQ